MSTPGPGLLEAGMTLSIQAYQKQSRKGGVLAKFADLTHPVGVFFLECRLVYIHGRISVVSPLSNFHIILVRNPAW